MACYLGIEGAFADSTRQFVAAGLATTTTLQSRDA